MVDGVQCVGAQSSYGQDKVGYVPKEIMGIKRAFGKENHTFNSLMLKFIKELRSGGAKVETVKAIWDCVRSDPELFGKLFKDSDGKKFISTLLAFIKTAEKGELKILQYTKDSKPYIEGQEAKAYIDSLAMVQKALGEVFDKETKARLQALLGTDKSISTIAKSGLASEVTEDKVGFVPPFLQYFKSSDEHLNKLVSKMVKEIREEGGASLETVNQVYGYINKTPGLLTNVFADSNCKKLMEGLIKLRVACEGNKLARLQYIPAGGTSPYIPPEEGRTYLAAVRSTKEQLQPIKLAMAQVITPLIEKPKVDLQAAKQVDTNPQTTTMKKSAKTYKRASTGVAYNLLSNTNGKVYIAGYLSGIVKNVTLEKVGSQLILKYTIKGKDYSVTIKDPKATISIYKETGGGPIKVGETKYDPFK